MIPLSYQAVWSAAQPAKDSSKRSFFRLLLTQNLLVVRFSVSNFLLGANCTICPPKLCWNIYFAHDRFMPNPVSATISVKITLFSVLFNQKEQMPNADLTHHQNLVHPFSALKLSTQLHSILHQPVRFAMSHFSMSQRLLQQQGYLYSCSVNGLLCS